MCGICGQYNYLNKEQVDHSVIKRMTQTLIHRGPDDEGYYIDGPLGLGFRRLSIIDLTGGHQPMSDQENSVWVIFNGEIYNFPELRSQLKNYGHTFRTNSDTEVIINGYKQWGTGVFNYLKGMFGLAIWDTLNSKLILARDALGIKNLYYQIINGRVVFGSEIKSVLAANGTHPKVDPVSLNLFLRYRYTPSPMTIFMGIMKLAPGKMLTFEDRSHRLERWYKFRPAPFEPTISINEAKEELLFLYKKAVKRHLLSDVPLGLLLSGGIDSGLLLGLMNINGESWPTYTVGYGESFKDDELNDAARTAKLFSSNHTSVSIDRDLFESSLPNIISFLEEPVATSSIVPMYFVCQRARQDVKVALIGQGPDELFGGYTRHLGVQYGSYWRSLPSFTKKHITRLIKSLPRNETLKRGVYALDLKNRMERYQHIFSIAPSETIDNLFHDGILPEFAGDRILDFWSDLLPLMDFTDELGGFQFLELRSSLPDELLMYADKLSMAHGLEVRVPYLDLDVVEFVECLNSSLKVRRGVGKWIHRSICKDFLPKSIMKRKKRGFASNIVDKWFYSSISNKYFDYLLDDNSLIYGHLRSCNVKPLLDSHLSGKNDNHKILFSLVLIEEWLRNYIV